MRFVIAIVLAGVLAACAQDAATPRLGAAPSDEIRPQPADVLPTRSRMEADRDDALKAIVRRKLNEADRAAYRAVTIEIWQGRMLLAGAVAKPEHRHRAEAVAQAQAGVTQVLNELLLAEEAAFSMFVPDSAREEAVRQALGIEGLTNGFAVRVLNQVAYLLGNVSSPAEIERLKAEAIDVEGVKWAVAHLIAP